MFGLRLILILAVVGGLIAFIGDKLGSKICLLYTSDAADEL